MPINCLVKFWTVMFKKSIHGQFVNNSWSFMFQKNDPFAFRLLSLPLSSSPFLFLPLFSSLRLFVSLSLPLFSSLFLSFPPLLSLFNTHSAQPANTLKTKDLKKRHFWLQILSQGKPLRIKTLGAKSSQYFLTSPPTLHSTRRPKPTLHAPSRNPTLCRLSCRICRPNPTHLTALIIKS